ncbi:helix-turn-helix transcriptional regulator [Bradyrhizobium sp. 150]|uniref:helix-turn-helix domain-containing protein n=1 Tax=Bradyrhizobium sp. 150 TaxID=2782625 RepID=UPI001FFB4A2C|nr:helix-turn-helix transcriptional regulator [Bradyrhizobium sp. 150]MCK1675368.1 helix-turn-helix transcriptional regulator [Bradyrhizobium sp. 150]
MSYPSEELVRTVQAKRTQERISQRALAVRSGLTQAHISQIETGRVEPGLSSFIQMVRALDLEVVLVPKKLLPAVEGILRSNLNEFSLEEGPSNLFVKAERIVSCGFRGLRPEIPIERDHAFRSKAATCSDEGGRGVVAGMRSWVRFSSRRQDWRVGQLFSACCLL